MNSNVGLTFFLKSLDQSFCFLNKNAFRLHAYCTFCVWCLNNETHGIVHINKDKRVLNEDKCTVFCVSCHEVILQNYFRCNLSCHVISLDLRFKIILLQYFQFSIFSKISGIQTDSNIAICLHKPKKRWIFPV